MTAVVLEVVLPVGEVLGQTTYLVERYFQFEEKHVFFLWKMFFISE